MVDARRHKINCWVPENLWEKVEALGYDSPTKATIAGYEALLRKEDSQKENEGLGNNWEKLGNNWENMGKRVEETQRQIKDLEENLRKAPDPMEFSRLQARSEELGKHNQTLKGQIKDLEERLKEAPDRAEFAKIEALLEGNQRLLEERNRTIEILNRDFENLNGFAHYFKNVEVKQIEAPSEKKRWWKFW